MARKTDFEACGLARGRLPVGGRHLLLSVDFEAFAPGEAPQWCQAMRAWARAAERYALPFAFFIAVEDVVRLRAACVAWVATGWGPAWCPFRTWPPSGLRRRRPTRSGSGRDSRGTPRPLCFGR
jgi:hypothetical protein